MIGIDLGLPAIAPRGGGGPPLLVDFQAGQYQAQGSIAPTFLALAGASFSRSGAGSALTSAGGVTAFATGVPRITDKGLLLEPARTNLCVQSWTPSNVGWVVNAGAKTSGQADPAGGTAAALFEANGAAAYHAIRAIGTTFTAGQNYTFSILVKPGTATRVQCAGPAVVFGGNGYVNFLLSGAGSVSANGGTVTASEILSIGGGWYLVSITLPCTSDGSGVSPQVSPLITGSEGRAASTASAGNFLVVGAQIEAAAAPSSPIVTATSSVTRGADVAAVTVPAGASIYEAIYGPSNTFVSGAVTPGTTFDMVTGRPWVGLGNELKRLSMR